jgi:hypothetical protein
MLVTLSTSIASVHAQTSPTTLDNTFFRVHVETGLNMDGIGTFTIATSDNHPYPNQDIFYDGVDVDPWSSYVTIILPDYQKAYVESTDSLTPPSGYQLVNMDTLNPQVSTGSNYVSITWNTPEGLLIKHEIFLYGDSLNNSLVESRVTVTNQGLEPVKIGVRYMWDIMIDGEDGSVIRFWDANGPISDWLYNETMIVNPTNEMFWQATNDEQNPLFYIWGSVQLPTGATPPDLLIYGAWPTLYDNVWNVTVDPNLVIAGDDTAVAYYWEDTLAAGESVIYRQFILAVTGAEEQPPPVVTTTIPTTTTTTPCLATTVTKTLTQTLTQTQTITETHTEVSTTTVTEEIEAGDFKLKLGFNLTTILLAISALLFILLIITIILLAAKR